MLGVARVSDLVKSHCEGGRCEEEDGAREGVAGEGGMVGWLKCQGVAGTNKEVEGWLIVVIGGTRCGGSWRDAIDDDLCCRIEMFPRHLLLRFHSKSILKVGIAFPAHNFTKSPTS
jgi:hypothetical protein